MQIYLLIEDDRQGPFTPEEIAAKLQNGECTPETLAWKEGMEDWQPLKDVCTLPAAPSPVSETTASKPVMAIRERALQRLRKRRHLKGLKGGCFLFCVGSVMCFLAFLLCLTGVGAILGVPIFIVGMGIAYVAAPAFGIALGRNKAGRVPRGPIPSTEPDPKEEPSELPEPSAPPSLPEMPAINLATVAGGINAVLEFFRAYKGLFQRIKSSPLPQPAQWYDRYPVVFPAAFLAFFFFGLGLIPLVLTSRLSGGDKGRLSLIAAWPLLLPVLTVIWPLLLLLILLLPVIALVMMWVKKWFTPAVRYTVTGIVGLGFVCLIVLLVIAAATDSGFSGEPRFSTGKPYDAMSTEERDAMEAAMEGAVVKIASNVFGGRNYVLGAEAAMYSKEAGGRFPLIVYITRDYLRDFTTLRSSQEKEAFVFTDMKSFFSQVKASSKFAGVKNVFLTYGANEFYDVYHNMGQSVPAGVLEFMLPMPTIKGTDWESLSNGEVERLFKLYGHYKVYKD